MSICKSSSGAVRPWDTRDSVVKLTWSYRLSLSRLEGISGSTSIVPLILTLNAGWNCVVHLTLRRIYPRHALNRRLGGPQSQSGRFEGDKNLLSLPGTETPPAPPSNSSQPGRCTCYDTPTSSFFKKPLLKTHKIRQYVTIRWALNSHHLPHKLPYLISSVKSKYFPRRLYFPQLIMSIPCHKEKRNPGLEIFKNISSILGSVNCRNT
jgi:hypothetical protein